MKLEDATSNSLIVLSSKWYDLRSKEEALTIYSRVVNFLLETYATEDFISEVDVDILCLTQRPSMTVTKHRKSLCNNALSSDRIYNKYVFKWIFIEGLH